MTSSSRGRPKLLMERREVQDSLAESEAKSAAGLDRIRDFLELLKTLNSGYRMGNLEEKRELQELVTSNRSASGKNVVVDLSFPYCEVAKRSKNRCCDQQRDKFRTLDQIAKGIFDWTETTSKLKDVEVAA